MFLALAISVLCLLCLARSGQRIHPWPRKDGFPVTWTEREIAVEKYRRRNRNRGRLVCSSEREAIIREYERLGEDA